MTREEYQEEVNDNPQPCPTCGNSDLTCLGSLGWKVYLRCHDCHTVFHLVDHGEVKA